jgi:hypothetical protein
MLPSEGMLRIRVKKQLRPRSAPLWPKTRLRMAVR